jgi:hypothetical protein
MLSQRRSFIMWLPKLYMYLCSGSSSTEYSIKMNRKVCFPNKANENVDLIRWDFKQGLQNDRRPVRE